METINTFREQHHDDGAITLWLDCRNQDDIPGTPDMVVWREGGWVTAVYKAEPVTLAA